MNENIQKEVITLKPFKHFCMSIGELPSSYLETMTYYEMLVWFTKYLQDTVIPTINNNGEAVSELQTLFVELQNYVNDYFDNLDVQEEINNKLDDMAEDGTLQEIITDYLNTKAIFAFDSISDLKSATNLINGSFVETYGFYSYGDGGATKYKVRTKTELDVPDDSKLIAIGDDLVAEIIVTDTMNVKQFGATGDGTTNDTLAFTNIISLCNNIEVNDGTYLINNLTINKTLRIFGNGTIIQAESTGLTLAHEDITIDGLTFNGNNQTYTIEANNNNLTVKNCTFVGEIGNYLRTNNYSYITYDNNLFDGSNVTGKLITPVVFLGSKYSKCINSTFINVKGFNIQTLLNAKNILIENNVFKNTIYSSSQTASSSQTSFTFDTDGKHYARTGIKVNNTFNENNTITETNTGYTVTFTVAPDDNAVVTLYGIDSLECVNINSNSYGIIVNNNSIDGTGDSGVVIGSDYHNGILNPSETTEDDYPSDITITNNYIKNCFYSGIAETHAAKNVLIKGNTIESCAISVSNMYDEYDSCIRVSGNNNTVDSNILKRNSNDIQKYGIIFRNSTQNENEKIIIANNQYSGNFENRKTSFSGATTAVVFAGIRDYEDSEELYGRCNINDSWSAKPDNDMYFAYNNYGSGVNRNTTDGIIDTAPCIGTIGSSYLDIYPTYPYFAGKILNIDFDCKANDTAGTSYFKVLYKSQDVLPYQDIEYRPTNTAWHHKRLQLVLDGCSTMIVRIGADSDAATSTFFQNIVFTVQNYK